MVQTDGGFAVKGVPERRPPGARSPAAAYSGRVPKGMEIGLQETAFFDPKREAWGFGTHVALVSIDRETGKLTIEKLVLVDDCGVVINPMIVEGQIHGGVAQGLGEAQREQMLYSDDGQVQTGTFMNYAIMRAGDMPPMILGETITPNPFNPLGVKGVGECGTNGAPPAVANALMERSRRSASTTSTCLHRAETWEAFERPRKPLSIGAFKTILFPRRAVETSTALFYCRRRSLTQLLIVCESSQVNILFFGAVDPHRGLPFSCQIG